MEKETRVYSRRVQYTYEIPALRPVVNSPFPVSNKGIVCDWLLRFVMRSMRPWLSIVLGAYCKYISISARGRILRDIAGDAWVAGLESEVHGGWLYIPGGHDALNPDWDG